MPAHNHDRRYYLQDIPVDEAVQRFHQALSEVGWLKPSDSENLSLSQAMGRVTAEAVWARASSPHYDAAAMDGIAVRALETASATETSPVRLSVGEQAVWLDTGDPMPEGLDAVVMVEVVHQVDDSTVEVQAPVAPYQHVRALGEDIVATELVLPENHRLRPQDLAACAAAGLSEVAVRCRPKAAIIPTGSELVEAGDVAEPGQIVDSNGVMLAAMIEEWGADALRIEPVPDDFNRIEATVKSALADSDLVVVNAGSSAGSEDYTAKVVEELGELLVHGIALRPGHPLVLGVVDGKPVLGIPGYPVSAAVTCELFVRPLIERRLGVRSQTRAKISAKMTRKVLSPLGEDEYLRVRAGRVGDKTVATPIQRGAGVIMSLVRADGFVLIPRFSEGVDAGEEVEVELLKPAGELEGTVVVIGSHDVALDLMASELHRLDPATTLASSNVGSLGGLLALSRGEAHMAGCHLLDEDTGQYNVSYVKRYLNGRDVVLVSFVDRVQGLIVPPGNPRALKGMEDLARAGVRFVNRQRGSGTRVLLDYMLDRKAMSADDIQGYEREEYNHLAVAAAVSADKADVGFGILSAARAMNMDFVPLSTEQYDLVIPTEFYGSDVLQPVLSLIRSDEFKQKVENIGGYEVTRMGEVVAELAGSRR